MAGSVAVGREEEVREEEGRAVVGMAVAGKEAVGRAVAGRGRAGWEGWEGWEACRHQAAHALGCWVLQHSVLRCQRSGQQTNTAVCHHARAGRAGGQLAM